MLQIQDLLKEMCGANASDLFIQAGERPCLRTDGEVRAMDRPVDPPEKVRSYAYEIMNEEQIAEFEKNNEMDLAIQVENLGRFRVNVYCLRGAMGVVLRHIPQPDFDFDKLGLPEAVRKLAEEKRGLVLVTGTTGSGKSTTLAAMIHHINQTHRCHVVTIEDPIEFIHTRDRSVISQREVGIDTKSFSAGLRHVLRQSPDVILIGEMRDLETIQTAIASAETGHLVFSTLHTTDAVQTVDRIINYFPGYLQHQIRMELSLTLQGAVSQRLLPKADGTGRVLATEIMVTTGIIRKHLLEGKTMELRERIQAGQHGMRTFDQHLFLLWKAKLITKDVSIGNATNPDEVRGWIDQGVEQ